MEYTNHAAETSYDSYILYKYTVYCDLTQLTIFTYPLDPLSVNKSPKKSKSKSPKKKQTNSNVNQAAPKLTSSQDTELNTNNNNAEQTTPEVSPQDSPQNKAKPAGTDVDKVRWLA